MFPQDEYDYLFQVQIVGDPQVGKSSLLHRYTEGFHSNSYISFINANFKIKTIVDNSKTVKLRIWDEAPQGELQNIKTWNSLRSTHVFILTFDLTNRDSFSNLENWIKLIRAKIENPQFVLVGTKSDLCAADNSKRAVTEEEALKFATEKDIHSYFETSAVNGNNVDSLFSNTAREAIEVRTGKKSIAASSKTVSSDNSTKDYRRTMQSVKQPSELDKLKDYIGGPEYNKSGKWFLFSFTPEHISEMLKANTFIEIKEIAQKALLKDSPRRDPNVQNLYEAIAMSDSPEDVQDKLSGIIRKSP